MKIKIPLLCFALALLFSVSMPLQAAKLNIGSAKYDAKKGELKVSGGLTGAPAGTSYVLANATSDDLLGSVLAGEKFSFKVTDFGLRQPPCSVRVQTGTQSATVSVQNAPANCDEFLDENATEVVTLAGVVRDAPIPYATVTVTVGGNTFTTVADANGNFVIEIAGIDLTSLVLIESTGPNPTDETRTVDLASIAGTLAKLVEDADANGIVDGTENPNINNTPYTTALFVLVGEANGGETPTTLEELQDAERSVDATELLQLAAVIKLIVDGGYELPIDPGTGEPYETIIGFLADAEVDGNGNTPVDNFIAANEEAIDTAVEEILNDNSIIPAFTAEGIPDRYYWLVPAQTGFLSRYGRAYDFVDPPTQTGAIRAIQSGGSGAIIEGQYDWDVINGKLVLDWTETASPIDSFFSGDGPEQLTLRCRKPDDPQFHACTHTCADYVEAFAASPYFQIGVTSTTTVSELTRYAVSAGGTREFASQTDVALREYEAWPVDYDGDGPNAPVQFQFCDEFEAFTSNVELLDAALNPPKPLAVGNFAGDTLAVPIIYDPDGPTRFNFSSGLFLDFVKLNDDPDVDSWRSTSTLLSGVTPKWRIVNGIELQFDYGAGVVQSLKQLEPSLDLQTAFWMEVNGVPQPYGRYDISLRVDPQFQFDVEFLITEEYEYWNPAILNAWQKSAWQTTPSGQLEITGTLFGWEFSDIPTSDPLFLGLLSGYNVGTFIDPIEGIVAYANPIPWEILQFPQPAGALQNLPAGTVKIVRFGSRNRYWIPIAGATVTVPENVNHATTPRRRFYVLEHEYNRFSGAMTIAPRINASEMFLKTAFPSP